jgi:DNA-binding response OmpR family regulator
MKILVVEDEIELADTLAEILKRNRYTVDCAHTGDSGLEYALTGLYDCILLDVMLPVMDGFTVLRRMRAGGVNTPVMMLTARADTEDKINGLDTGADDYLTKPFITSELLARIRSLTRRKGEIVSEDFSFGSLSLNKKTYSISAGPNDVRLSLKEYQIMEMLIANPRQIIPKERFIEKIWGYDSDVEYNNIEVYISFLRKKLASIHANVRIKTARGIGYTLETED